MNGLSWLNERPALRTFAFIRASDELGAQVLNVAIGWQIYATTHDPMSLAYVGLAQFLPDLGLLLPAGHLADRFDRRRIVAAALLLQAAGLTAYMAWPVVSSQPVAPAYILLLTLGVARTFLSPAMSAMLPQTVSKHDFPRAVAMTSSAFQLCSMVGPALGGFLFAASSSLTIAVVAALPCLALLQVRYLPPDGRRAGGGTHEDLFAGLRYFRSNRLVLALASLDLFVMLLGGVSALLPIYARDLLAVGSIGLGGLRCAPGLGATAVGLVLAMRPIRHHQGKVMLAGVAGFGVATIAFALSANFWFSLAALAVAGGFDMISMVVRQALVQLFTPDVLRGRIGAITGLFIGASAQLGEFESGLTAALFGAMPAALLGGIGALAVVILWAMLFPELRQADTTSCQTGIGAHQIEVSSQDQAA
jgi:MFS family permease